MRHLHVIGSVRSQPAREPLNTTPVAARSFPREAYRDQAQPDTTSVIDETPGALIDRPFDEDFAVPDIPVYALVRGGLPYETPVAIDGSPISLPSTGTFDLALVPTYVLQQVEIVKGQGDPAALGGGANGALNLETALPTGPRRGMIEFEGDSHGGQFSDLAYDGTMPGGKVAFSTMASIDGEPGPLAGAGVPGNPASNALRKALLLHAEYTPSQALQVTGTFLATNLDRALAGTYGALLGRSFVSLAPILTGRQDERLRFEQLGAEYDSGLDDFEVRLYDFSLASEGYTGLMQLAQADDAKGGLDVAWTHRAGPNSYTLSIAGDSAGAYDDDPVSLAPFGQRLAPGSEAGSVRSRFFAGLHPGSKTEIEASFEGVENVTRVGTFGAVRDWSSLDGRLGVSQMLTPHLVLRASFGSAGIVPPLDVLAGGITPQISYGLPTQVFDFSSFVTSEERAQGGDAGVEWRLHGDTTTLSFDAYDTTTSDAYVLWTTPIGRSDIDARWENVPFMRDEGIELSLVQFKPIGLGFIIQGAMPRTYGSGPAAFSNASFSIAGIPYAQGYGEISYKWPRGSRASFGILAIGANNAYGRPAFATVNTNLELSVGARSKFQLSTQNLLGAHGGALPLLFAGTTGILPAGEPVVLSANVLGPPTVRVMFRQSFGQGSIFEH